MSIRRFLHAATPALLLALAAAPTYAAPWKALVSLSGNLSLSCGDKAWGNLEAGLFESDWRGASAGAVKYGDAPSADGVRRSQLRTPSGVIVDVTARATPVADGIRMEYQLTPREDVRLNSLHVGLGVPINRLQGGNYVIDGKRAAFPAQYETTHLYSAPARSLVLNATDGASLRFDFAQPTPLLIQDDRQWGPDFMVRIGPQMPNSQVWSGGKPLALDFTLSAQGGIAVEYDGPITIEAGPDWLPLDLQLEVEAGSALDFSQLVPWHTPAGKLGRVIATPDGKMAFASRPKEPVRFYGFNMVGTSQYITHEQAEQLATRLQRLGYNAVRLHHHEGTLVDRSGGSSTTCKPLELDQLDYFFAALKKRGIYVTTDLFVSRPIYANEVWPDEKGDVGMDEFKMAAPVNERAFANYKAFAVNLLGHVNPYTGMRWVDDPALAWLSLINEGNPGNFTGRMTDRLKKDYTVAWNRWLAEHYPTRDALVQALGSLPAEQDPKAGTVALPNGVDDTPTGIQYSLFLTDNQRAFFERTRAFLRDELHCQALLTNLNAWTNPLQLQSLRAQMDYVDDHFYVDHPQFLEKNWQLPSRCPNTSPVAAGAPGGRSCPFLRLMDRPFTISEYNYSGPGRFRGVGGILTGALGAVQDGSIIWRFAYSHSRENLFAPSTAGSGYFDMATDPLSQAADRASLCLFRRGDMRPATHSVAIAMTPAELMQQPKSAHGTVPPWTGLAWVTRVGTVVTNDPAHANGADLLLPLGWKAKASEYGAKALPLDPYAADTGAKVLAEMRKRGWVRSNNKTDFGAPRFQSETGELTVDGPEDMLTLNTPRSAGGYAPAGKTIKTDAATIAVEDTDATVWVSSVDGAPIRASRRLLITHLTDMQNSSARYGDKARQVLLSWGKLPHLVHNGRATVTLKLKNPERAHVWGLATSGKRLQEIPTRVVKGALVIPLAINADGKARMLYEVAVE